MIRIVLSQWKKCYCTQNDNGTGQFIRDYMFPKSDSGTIETISEQLDAYRQIREKIEDMRKRIELLKEIKESGQELVNIQSDIVMAETMNQVHRYRGYACKDSGS